ncbi:FAD-dependent monooxygenase [Streptomyces sp. NPDC048172]|uniref:FAD-dependent monooxygenase n=1 Tax=Streptomyces sp. NPDC048172 TaxID=3365505 RepID=UPI0037123E4B
MVLLNVAVVGGSIAGCAAALAVSRGGGARVTVFERAAGELRSRGVGVSLHNDRYAELEAAGYVDAAMPWAELNRRIWTVRDGETPEGRAIATHPFPFRAYGWGSLWNELRRRVPDGVDYRTDAEVAAVEPDADGVTLRFGEDGSDDRTERFDAVIGADGYRSVVRNTMFPELSPDYSGYLAWRGSSPGEGPGTDAHIVVFPGGHCMIYRIPGPDGEHRVNWVLYTVPPPLDGTQPDLRTPTSLPPGRLTEDLTEHLRALVAEHFPPVWAECVLSTPVEDTLVQPIYDMEVPHYATGRLLLVGDAATVARPHTGGGSVKALQDACSLEAAWRAGDGDLETVLAAYDADRTSVGATMVALGRRLGHAQVENTPDWAAMREPDLEAWWQRQHQGDARSSGFGGQALDRP